MTYMTNEQREINASVRKYFKAQGISMRDAGLRLDMTEQSVINQINNRVFSEKIAAKWAKVFGFSERFLLTGKGTLIKKQTSYQKLVQENAILNNLVKSLRHIVDNQKKDIDVLKKENIELKAQSANAS